MQNRAATGFSVPHEGQARGRAAPQLMQKRATAGLSVAQAEHAIEAMRSN
jgi:hypothetical protein